MKELVLPLEKLWLWFLSLANPKVNPGSLCSPRVLVGFRHRVEVDGDGKIHFADLQDYRNITNQSIWDQLNQMASNLVSKKIKISFFNSTPQGKGF